MPAERQLRHVELLEGEQIVDAWIAGTALGKRGSGTETGGSLVLTDRRVPTASQCRRITF